MRKKSTLILMFLLSFCVCCLSLGAIAFADAAQKPDVSNKTNVITQVNGSVAASGWGASVAGNYSNGSFWCQGSDGQSGCYKLNNSLSGGLSELTTYTAFEFERDSDTGWYQWVFRGDDQATDFAALKWHSNGAIGFWSRVGGTISDIDTSLGGSAVYTPIFVNTADFFGSDFMAAEGAKAKFEILSEPTCVSVWVSEWTETAYSEAKLVVNKQAMPKLNATAMPFYFGNISGGKYMNIAMYDVNESSVSIPDVSEKTDIITQEYGKVTELGFGGGGNAIYSEDGTFTVDTAQNGRYPFNNKLTGKETVNIINDNGTIAPKSSMDLRIFQEVEMWPNAMSNHVISFSPRGGSDGSAIVILNIGVNVAGSAHGFNVFIEDRAVQGALGRKYMISDVRTFLGNDFNLSATDGSQRVKLQILTEGGKLTLWMSYSLDGGKTFSEAKMVYNQVDIVKSYPQHAPMFLNTSGSIFGNMNMYCMDRTESAANFPDVSGKENLITQTAGVVNETGGFGGGPAAFSESGVLTGNGGANAKYTIASSLNDAGYVEIVTEQGVITVKGNDLSVYNEVTMWPDATATHTLNFSPRSNSQTGSAVIVRIGTNKAGSAHGFNVFIEDREVAGAFDRRYMIGDVRALLGAEYDLSKTDGSQRVKIATVTQAHSLSLWMCYSLDSGSTYSDYVNVYNEVKIANTTPHAAAFFLDGGSGVFTDFKMYSLTKLAPPYIPPAEPTYPETPAKPPINDEQISPVLPERPFNLNWLWLIVPCSAALAAGGVFMVIFVSKKIRSR